GAQNGASNIKGTVCGVVTENDDGAPVEYAVVILYPAEVYTTTDSDGKYRFNDVDPGEHKISVQYVGMESVDSTFTLQSGSVCKIDVKMVVSSFHLEKVVVTAVQNKAGESTSSTISRQAMDHMQTSSLKDVMALLPGAVIQNPDLSKASNLTLRSVAEVAGSAANDMNSLGTAVYIDGAPISNNANMQIISTGINGTTENKSGASPGTGIDVRNISTDNVESIEVIRGIPSAEYGDLTSGAVIVKSKAGIEPLIIRFKTNPQLYQASASKGFSLGEKWGNLNVSGDYAYNNALATASYQNYQRFNAKLLWSIRLSNNFSTNTSMDFTYGKDTYNRNQDEDNFSYMRGATSVGVRFNNNGNWVIDRGWLKSVNYAISGSYTDKNSFLEEQLSSATAIYSTSMVDGAVISNRKGQHVYDASGNEITNFTGTDAVNSFATVTPYTYFCRYDIYGKEINGYAKLVANFFKQWGDNLNDRIKIGADFKTDGNMGKGLVFKEGYPPMKSTNSGESGYRSRPYYDIPFVNQIGLFAEDELNLKIAGRNLIINAGGRFDWVNGKTVVVPRLNASFELFPGVLTLRGGYGVTAKAPTELYLYPQDVYFDQINYNGLESSLPEAEQLLVSTTKIYSTRNADLKIATNRKYELGFDLKIAGKYRLSVTGYDEEMKNGYDLGSDVSSFAHNEYVKYEVDHTNAGTIPTLKVQTVYNYLFHYYKPLNSSYSRNRGLEYEIDLGRFDDINTSVYVNGAFMRSTLSSSMPSYSYNANLNTIEADVAVYPAYYHTYNYDQAVTTFRFTTNIPEIGFVITLTPQVLWYTANWLQEVSKDASGNYVDEKYSWYIDHKDGQLKDATDEYINDSANSYMLPQLWSRRFEKDWTNPTVVLNFNLTKEIGDLLTASFFVNNMFNSRPLQESKVSTGVYTEMNDPIFFGMEVKMSIR
ncbi:MAG: TonB-dependent receptor, partial [Bacteroidales bacterium]|nr:TonB-dependent receptor [Bacteroidales bacterium]